MQGFKLLTVELALLLLAWEAVPEQETHFGAIQPHSFSAKFPRPLHVGRNTGIDPKCYRAAVRGSGRLCGQRRQLFKQRLILGQQTFKSCQQVHMRIDVYAAVITVDHQLLVWQSFHGQVLNTHHGRNTHSAGQYRRMTVGAATHGYNANQSIPRNLSQCRGGKLLGHEHRRLRIINIPAVSVLQITQHPGAQITHIYRALS